MASDLGTCTCAWYQVKDGNTDTHTCTYTWRERAVQLTSPRSRWSVSKWETSGDRETERTGDSIRLDCVSNSNGPVTLPLLATSLVHVLYLTSLGNKWLVHCGVTVVPYISGWAWIIYRASKTQQCLWYQINVSYYMYKNHFLTKLIYALHVTCVASRSTVQSF